MLDNNVQFTFITLVWLGLAASRGGQCSAILFGSNILITMKSALMNLSWKGNMHSVPKELDDVRVDIGNLVSTAEDKVLPPDICWERPANLLRR